MEAIVIIWGMLLATAITGTFIGSVIYLLKS